jgi:hypothetical protein
MSAAVVASLIMYFTGALQLTTTPFVPAVCDRVRAQHVHEVMNTFAKMHCILTGDIGAQ